MNSRIILSISLGLAILLLAGAMPVAADAADGGDGGEVGVCVIGVDSPCNGDEYNGSDNTTTSDPSEPVQYDTRELPYATGVAEEPVEPVEEPAHEGGDMGICVIGADSPCNGEQYDGSEDREVSDGLPLAPEDCVPGPATMCAPEDRQTSDRPVSTDEMRCIRAPCVPPSEVEYCVDGDGVVMECALFPENADIKPHPAPTPEPLVLLNERASAASVTESLSEGTAVEDVREPPRSSFLRTIDAVVERFFGLFGF